MKRVLILSPDPDLTSHLRRKLADTGWADVAVESTYPPPGQLSRLITDRRPALVLIGLSEPEYAFALIEVFRTNYPGIPVAATHSINVPDLILHAVRTGAGEYLGPPFEVEYLARLLENRPEPASLAAPKGRMIAFLPAAGGCGASTVAVHIAAAMARATRKKVLFIDWDQHAGTTAFRLRLKPEFGLPEALERSNSLDEFWPQIVCSWKGIDLLAPGRPESLGAEEIGRFSDVIASARRTYDWVVSDLPAMVYGGFESVFPASETIFVVCTPDIISLHLARRRFEELRRLGVRPDSVKLVVNREAGISYRPEEIKSLVGVAVARTLPNDYRALAGAWIEGRLVTDGDLGKLFHGFARDLLGSAAASEAATATSSWRPIPKFLAAPTG